MPLKRHVTRYSYTTMPCVAGQVARYSDAWLFGGAGTVGQRELHCELPHQLLLPVSQRRRRPGRGLGSRFLARGSRVEGLGLRVLDIGGPNELWHSLRPGTTPAAIVLRACYKRATRCP
eukprot:3941348-Rhodomonas_salina.4